MLYLLWKYASFSKLSALYFYKYCIHFIIFAAVIVLLIFGVIQFKINAYFILS